MPTVYQLGGSWYFVYLYETIIFQNFEVLF